MKKTISSLTSLRGLACIAVIRAHQRSDPPWAPSGGMAVNFFFALSAFLLIKRAADDIFENKITCNFMKAYVFRRICRVYPAYIVALMLYHIMYLLDWYPDSKIWKFAWTAPFIGTHTSHLWTMEIELMFYFIMFPIVVTVGAFLISKSYQNNQVDRRYWMSGIAALILIGVVFTILVHGFGFDPLLERYWMFMLGCIGGFAAGAREKYYSHILPSQPSVNRLCNIAAWALLICVFFTNYHNSTTFLGVPRGSWVQGDLVCCIVYVLCMLLLEFAEDETSVGRGLQANFLVMIGDLSYSAYLIHNLVIITLNGETSLGDTDAVTCSIVIILLLSRVLYSLEMYVVKTGNKFIKAMGWEIRRKHIEKIPLNTAPDSSYIEVAAITPVTSTQEKKTEYPHYASA